MMEQRRSHVNQRHQCAVQWRRAVGRSSFRWWRGTTRRAGWCHLAAAAAAVATAHNQAVRADPPLGGGFFSVFPLETASRRGGTH